MPILSDYFVDESHPYQSLRDNVPIPRSVGPPEQRDMYFDSQGRRPAPLRMGGLTHLFQLALPVEASHPRGRQECCAGPSYDLVDAGLW